MSVNSRPVGLQQGLTILGHSQEKSFIDSHHKKSWLQNLEYILLKARYPIQALKRIIDDIIKNTSLVSEEENCDMVCVRQKDEIRFLENEVDIVSSIMNTVKEMFSLGLFNSSPRQFSMEILKIIEHYSAKSGIRTQIKDAIESSLLVRGSNLGIGQLISRFQFMQELSAKFPMLIDPVIQRRVLANVVFCLPKQNPDNGLYFLPRLDKSTHALLPPDLLKRYQEFFSRKGLNILARPPIALLEEERTHLLPKKYLLLAAAIGSLLIIAAAVAANIAASPAGVSIGAIIIFSLAIIKLYQTYFSTHHDDRSSLIPDIGIFNPAKQ